jgi:iron(III) transport system substrate-binding protein
MVQPTKTIAIALVGFFIALRPEASQSQPAIEDELVLITPVAKTLTDPALAEFAKYAKEKWNVTVKTSALAAGTPVAYGQIVEWKGRPGADIFWGGESALFDKLAEQNLVVKLDLPQAVVDAIPASIGKPKPIPLKDPKGYWVGTVLEPYGLVYQPKVLQRLGVPEPKDWGRPAPSQAQGACRAVRAHALEQQPRDLRGHSAA